MYIGVLEGTADVDTIKIKGRAVVYIICANTLSFV